MMSFDLDFDLHEARERVSEQVLTANTLLEIEAAKQVLREWMKAHPEEQGMRAGFEQLYTIQEIIEQEEAGFAEERTQPVESFSTNPQRQRILNQALDARTLPEITTAAQELREWVRQNPADIGIREAFEGLSLMRDIAEEQEAERTHTSREVVSAQTA